MSSPGEERPQRRWFPAAGWHLLWAEPAALAGSYLLLIAATFWRCGFTECHDGIRGSLGPTVVLTVPTALTAAAPIAAIPWGPVRPRLLVATGMAVVVGAAVATSVFSL